VPLSATNFVNKGAVLHADLLQFYSLFTGAMADQPVTFKNTVTVGGNQGISTVPLKLYGAISQTTHLIDLYLDTTQSQPGFGFGARGDFSWGPGGASPQDTFLSRIGLQNGHSSDTSGLLISPLLEVAGNLQAQLYGFPNGTQLTSSGPFALSINQDLTVQRYLAVASAAAIAGTPSSTTALLVSPSALTSSGQSGVNVQLTSSAAATGLSIAYQASVATAAAAYTTSYAVDYWAGSPAVGAGSVITNAMGLHVTNQGKPGVTNAYGVHIDGQSGASTINEGLHNDGSSTLMGLVGIGTTPVAGTPLVFAPLQSGPVQAMSWKDSGAGPIYISGNTVGGAPSNCFLQFNIASGSSGATIPTCAMLGTGDVRVFTNLVLLNDNDAVVFIDTNTRIVSSGRNFYFDQQGGSFNFRDSSRGSAQAAAITNLGASTFAGPGGFNGVTAGTGAYGLGLPNVANANGVGIAYAWSAYSCVDHARAFNLLVEPVANAVGVLRALVPYHYAHVHIDPNGRPVRGKGGAYETSLSYGFSAQEVSNVLPELAQVTVEPQSLDLMRMVVILWAACQQLEQRIRTLEGV
jgi:hypothetical protein